MCAIRVLSTPTPWRPCWLGERPRENSPWFPGKAMCARYTLRLGISDPAHLGWSLRTPAPAWKWETRKGNTGVCVRRRNPQTKQLNNIPLLHLHQVTIYSSTNAGVRTCSVRKSHILIKKPEAEDCPEPRFILRVVMCVLHVCIYMYACVWECFNK